MIYIVAVLLPPLYFAIQKKWLAATVTSFLLFVCVFMWLAIPVLWPVCAICAIWDLRKALVRENASAIAQEVGKTMRQQPPALR